MFRFIKNPDPRKKPPYGSRIDPTHPLAQGLMGCWLFNEGGGDKVYNLCSYNNDELVGFSWEPSNAVHGILENNDGDEIQITPLTIKSGVDYTYIWSGLVTAFNGDNPGLWRTGPSSYRGDFCAFYHDTGLPWIRWNSANILHPTTIDGNQLSKHVHSHTAWCVKSGAWCGWYNNSKLKYDATHSVSTTSNDAIYQFGWQSTTSQRISGVWEHQMIYERLLNDDEIAQLYAEPYCFIQNPRYWYMVDFGAAAGGTGRISLYGDLNGLGGMGQQHWNPLE